MPLRVDVPDENPLKFNEFRLSEILARIILVVPLRAHKTL